MAINFPNSPSTNDIHVSGANRWQWNGSSWTRIGGVNSDADAINSTNDNSTTTLYPVMVTGTGTQTAKVATSATKNISFDASEGNLTVGGNISVGGTITYEDVTNVDSIGIITARAGVIVTGNLDTDTLYVSGIATNIGGINVGTAGTISSAGNLTFDKPGAGIITATKFVGSGAELTGVISGVGIQSGGAVIGSGVTTLNFIGVGNTFKYTQGTDTVDVSISASAVSISETAPSSPNDGDLWWDSDNGNLHIYYEDGNSNQWITASSSGPQGPQGAQGVQGAQGHQGRQGSVGIASLTISTGVPGSPAQGDMWWDSDDGDLHLYYNDGNSSQWININAGSAGAQGVQGATGSTGAGGAQGAQGHQGVQGAAGAQGAQGRQGAAGSTTTINNNANNRVITGSGTANTLEAESDFTWDDSAKRLVVGSQIVRIGDSAGSNSGSRSTTVGNSAGNNSGSYSVNIGNNTGSGSGSYSVNVGANSVGGNAGSYSVNIGGNAVGYSNPATGSINIGSQYAGYSNAGEHCINIGYAAGYQSGGKYGVNIGYNAGNMHLVSSSHNVAIGYEALKNEGANKYCIGIGASCYLPIKGEATGASDNQLVIGVGHTAWIVGTKNYNIGLGVTNPGGKLHIGGIGSGDIVAELDSGSPTFTYRNGSGAWFHAGKHPSQDAFIIADGANTTTNERFRITNGGSVGIGTVGPDSKLHVHSGSVRVTNTAKTNVVELSTDGNIEIKRTGGYGYIDFADGISEDADVRIQQVANGFEFTAGGQGSRTAKLNINASGDTLLATGTIRGDAYQSMRLGITNTTSTSDHYWKIGEATMNGSEAFSLDIITGCGYGTGAGTVVHTKCIARATNASTLEGYWHSTSLSGAAGVKDIRWKYTGANNIYEIWVKGNQYANISPIVNLHGGLWTAFNTNTGSSSAPASSTAFQIGQQYTQIDAYNTIQYNQQNTTFLQNIKMANTKGIDFSATADAANNANVAELLDDYEEGRHIITVTGSSSNPTVNVTHPNLWYVKVGSMVHMSGELRWTTSSHGSGTLRISLPFAAKNLGTGHAFQGTAQTWNIDWKHNQSSTDYILSEVGGNTSYMFIRCASNDNLNENALQLGSSVIGSANSGYGIELTVSISYRAE